jgi:hypothetical protein
MASLERTKVSILPFVFADILIVSTKPVLFMTSRGWSLRVMHEINSSWTTA